ncbi:MAG: tagaturonate epimerase family protein [Caldilineales bacterium]
METTILLDQPSYPRSVATAGDSTYALLSGDDGEKCLAVAGPAAGFDGERQGDLLLCPLTADNAAALRQALPWLQAQPLGLRTSVGCGDRLGLATPGHLRAVRKAAGVAPILAQQSIRENARTGRTPQEVMDDALWGVFQEGWRDGFGADADHLKTTADADVTAAAGYTFFTVDPGDHVDDAAHTASPAELEQKFAALPWRDLESSPVDQRARYLGTAFELEDRRLTFDEESLLRAAGKYARAVAHAARMYCHLDGILTRPWELEVSVDETATPTSHLEHLYIVSEMRRLGVRWVSLAPRYVGSFEKGVDYIGDLHALRADLAGHAAIARSFGPYKLSLHSGSDKFSVYPIAVEETRRVVHLKTAGTSYLEALRAIAQVDPALFREIYWLAFERYDEDRRTYHVSAQPARAPQPASLADGQLPAVLDQFDAREMLHVTFGSALARYGADIKRTLRANEESHYAAIEAHFDRHLAAFAEGK